MQAVVKQFFADFTNNFRGHFRAVVVKDKSAMFGLRVDFNADFAAQCFRQFLGRCQADVHFFAAVHRPAAVDATKDVFGMLGKVAVDSNVLATVRIWHGNHIVPAWAGDSLAVYPVIQAAQRVSGSSGEAGFLWLGFWRRLCVVNRFLARQSLPQNHHIGHDRRTGILLVSAAGHAIGCHQIARFHQLLADRGIRLVKRAGGCDVHHQPARLGKIGRFQEEIVMDLGVVLVVAKVADAVLAERNVAGHQFIKVVGRRVVLKALHFDASRRVQGLEHCPCLGFQFNRCRVRSRRKICWHLPEVISNAGRCFQEFPARVAELPCHLPVSIHNFGVREMGVQRRFTGRRPFLRCHHRPQFVVLFRPVATLEVRVNFFLDANAFLVFRLPRFFGIIEHAGKCPPADILGDDRLFFWRSNVPAFDLHGLDRPDRSDIVPELGFEPALGEIAGVIHPVASGKIGRGFRRRRLRENRLNVRRLGLV